MLGLSPNLPKTISIFEQLRVQREVGQEYCFEESDDNEGDTGGMEYEFQHRSLEYSHPQRDEGFQSEL